MRCFLVKLHSLFNHLIILTVNKDVYINTVSAVGSGIGSFSTGVSLLGSFHSGSQSDRSVCLAMSDQLELLLRQRF